MANTRLSMRKIKETHRLHFESGLGQRPIARCLNISRTTVADYLHRTKAAGLSGLFQKSSLTNSCTISCFL